MAKAYFQYYETFEMFVLQLKTAEERDSLRGKIISYGFYGIEPETFTPVEEVIWPVIKDAIDEQKHKRQINKENRAKREAAKAQEKAAKEEPKPEEPKVEAPAEEKPKVKKFVKPTVEEVEAYCKERGNTINAQQFWDYYETRGWKTKAGPIKDWRAGVRTWEARATETHTGYSAAPPPRGLPEDRLTFD